jgi:hypothetical protein
MIRLICLLAFLMAFAGCSDCGHMPLRPSLPAPAG